MAYLRKTKNGYRVEVFNKGIRKSASLPTKRECQAWAVAQENVLHNPSKHITLEDLLLKYYSEVLVKKKSAEWEHQKITHFIANQSWLASKNIADITKSDISTWQDIRLKTVSPGTVLREWTILSSAFKKAINDWDWLTVSPMTGVSRPQAPPPRERTITDRYIELMDHVLKYSDDGPLELINQRVGAAFHFALDTAMRAQEIYLLQWEDIEGRVLKVKTSKTRSGIREVPLSKKAQSILERLKSINSDKELVFNLKGTQLDAHFRKAKKQAGVSGFTFHDARATAITRLAKKLDILDLARMIGHKNLSMLMIYYRESAESIADKL